MSYAHRIVSDYFRRRNVPPDSQLDGLYQYEVTLLRDMLDRLEVVLDDEGVPREVAERVIRCMLYGSPSPAAAEERMRRESETAEMLNSRAASIHVSGIDPDALAKLGLPPQAGAGA
jgi:hypothetical protein